MATITMDSSEWESMKKNIQLLEESKKREEELNNEIKKLQDEKMEVLKSNEKNVTIVKRTDKYEIVYNTKSPQEIFKKVYQIIEQSKRGWISLDSVNIEELVRIFFNKTESHSLGVDETITTRGFDEVRSEFQAKYKEELEEETKRELATIPALERRVRELKEKLFKVDPERKKLQDDNFKILKENLELRKEVDTYKKHISEIRNIFSPVLDSTWNVFNYGDMKSRLTTLIWQYEKI